ncbi:hypothetical protein [Saccharopolyspora erythraea]|nr:hypothetical protein [Saccharopolyspora erythraea]
MGLKFQVTFDARDPAAQARFWGPRERWDDFAAVRDPDGKGPA